MDLFFAVFLTFSALHSMSTADETSDDSQDICLPCVMLAVFKSPKYSY